MNAGPAGSPARDWRTAFDLSDPSFGDQFDAIADDLVAHCPMARTVDDKWVASRYADVARVLLESDLFSSGSGIRGATFHPKHDELLKPNEMDQSEHGWLRHSWDRHFTRAAIIQHEPAIRDIVNGLIDGFIDRGRSTWSPSSATRWRAEHSARRSPTCRSRTCRSCRSTSRPR